MTLDTHTQLRSDDRSPVVSAGTNPTRRESINTRGRDVVGSVILPLPPSTNHIWEPNLKNARKRMKRSAEYRAWLRDAGWQLNIARSLMRVSGAYMLTIELPRSMPGDIDNRIKAISDLLVAHRIVTDDRLAQSILILRTDDLDPRECRVALEPFLMSATPCPGVAAARGHVVGSIPPTGGVAEAAS